MKQTAFRLALGGLFLIAFLCFGFPMYVIRPFRAQGATELSMALAVRAWGPSVALLSACASFAIVVLFWRRESGGRPRAGAAVAFLLTAGFAASSHVNVFEQMFHPVAAPGFIAAGQAKVDTDDMVLAVAVAGDRRAYPIRTMGYHHIVNDWVGREPIVATY